MKKSYLLSGMIALTSIIAVNAMEDRRAEASQKMEALMPPYGSVARVDWQAVFAILDSMKDVINVNEYRTRDKSSLLDVAVMNCRYNLGDLSSVQQLLERYKADPNIVDDRGWTPIHYASMDNRDDLVPLIKLLLEYGAKPTTVEEVTYKTIGRQKELARPAIYKMIDPLVVYKEVIDWPAVFSMLDSMQGAIGVNDYRTPSGDTLLKLAIEKKNFAAVKALREKYGAIR
jgi:ankyrin repeat protein